jgi:hypothetical protein
MRKIIVHMPTKLDGRTSKPNGSFWKPFPSRDGETGYVNQMFAAEMRDATVES